MKFWEKYKALQLWIAAFLFVAAVIVFYKTVDSIPTLFRSLSFLTEILRPFVIGFAVAFILYAPTNKLEGLIERAKFSKVAKLARPLSIAAVYLSLVLVIVIVLSVVLPKLVGSINNLSKALPGYFETAKDFIDAHLDEEGKLLGFDVKSILNNFTPEKILSYFNTGALASYADGVFKFGSAVVDFFIALVVSVYMLLGRESLLNALSRVFSLLIPRRAMEGLKSYLHRICEIFYNFLYSQCLDALIVSILTSIAFTIIGVPYSILFGFMMGLFNLIPYFGAIIGGALTVLVTALTGHLITALIAAITIIVIQQIDGNLIQPRIVGNTVGIRPIYVLFAITVGSGLFGIWGMLLGVPIIAVIRMLILDLIAYREIRRTESENTERTGR